ncbi:serine/arginine repetitive matrix protein 1-like [Rhopilema esculentum]|uniref:serine/arginine repetitive matrix protein 1-like n=1 Tax=Rhopilema esculentum TaxID=499914 RepID=UPI0031DCB1E5
MSCKVYVGNLGENGDRDALEQEFSKFGTVENVWVAQNPPGFAFVFFNDHQDAEKAARSMDNKRVCGVKIKAELSHHSDDKKPPGMGDRGKRGRGMARGRARGISRDDNERRPGPGPDFPRQSRLPGPRPHDALFRGPPGRGDNSNRSHEPFDRRRPPPRRSPPPRLSERESSPRVSRRPFQEGPPQQRSPPRMGRMRQHSPGELGFEPPRSRMSPRREGPGRIAPGNVPPRRQPAYDSPPRGLFSNRQSQPLQPERLSLKRPLTDRSLPRDLLFKRSSPRRNHSFESPGEIPSFRGPPEYGQPGRDLPPRRSFDGPPRGPLRGSSPGAGRSRFSRRSPPGNPPPGIMSERSGGGRESFYQDRRFESRERNPPLGPPGNRSAVGRRADAYSGNGFSEHQGIGPAGRRQQDFATSRPDEDYEFSRIPKRGSDGRFNDRPQGERLPKRIPPSLMGDRMSDRPPPPRRGDRPPPGRGFQRSRSPLR